MSERLDLRELAGGLRRLWLIPLLLAAIGMVVGGTASTQVSAVYRSQATVLVGPTNGAVTHTSTIRTSEDLAIFYADMARRQIILQPVVDRLDLAQTWAKLRDRVSAVVPKENLRLVTVTVMGANQADTDAIANALVDELVSLSPAASGTNDQAFINEQADSLKQTIKQTQERILRMEAEAEAAEATDSEQADAIRREITDAENRVGSWQRIYVELIGTEPTSDAGGLQVLDEASAVTDMGRSAPVKQLAVGGVVGGVLGLMAVWLLSRNGRHKRRDPLGPELRAVEVAPPETPSRVRPTANGEHPVYRHPNNAGLRAQMRTASEKEPRDSGGTATRGEM